MGNKAFIFHVASVICLLRSVMIVALVLHWPFLTFLYIHHFLPRLIKHLNICNCRPSRSREWLMDRCSVWSAVTRVRPKHVKMSRHITPHHHNARLRSNDININMTATEMSCSLTQMTSQCWRLCDDSWSLWPVLTRSGWLPIYHLSAEASNDGPSWRYLLIRHLYQFHLMIFSVAWHCILQTQWE